MKALNIVSAVLLVECVHGLVVWFLAMSNILEHYMLSRVVDMFMGLRSSSWPCLTSPNTAYWAVLWMCSGLVVCFLAMSDTLEHCLQNSVADVSGGLGSSSWPCLTSSNTAHWEVLWMCSGIVVCFLAMSDALEHCPLNSVVDVFTAWIWFLCLISSNTAHWEALGMPSGIVVCFLAVSETLEHCLLNGAVGVSRTWDLVPGRVWYLQTLNTEKCCGHVQVLWFASWLCPKP